MDVGLNCGDKRSIGTLNQIWTKAQIGPIDKCRSTANHWTYDQKFLLADTWMPTRHIFPLDVLRDI